MLLGTTRPLPTLLAFPPSCLCGLDLLSCPSLERNENLDLAPTRAKPYAFSHRKSGTGSRAPRLESTASVLAPPPRGQKE